MALRPQDVYHPIEADREEIENLEKQIDASLRSQARFRGGVITLGVDLFGRDIVIREELFKRYRRAGWKVTHNSDQRDGDYISMEAPDRDSPPDAEDMFDHGPGYGYPGR